MLYEIRIDDKWGYINSSGEVVIPAKADESTPFANGFGGLLNGHRLEIVNVDGHTTGVTENVFLVLLTEFSEGLLCVGDLESRGVGYLDTLGNWAIPPKFRKAGNFCNGVAISSVASSPDQGIIDHSGAWICDSKYHRIFNFASDTSSTVAYTRFARFGNSLKCILIDKTGDQICDEVFDNAHRGGQGFVPVERESKWGVVNQHGELVIPFAFDGINPFSEDTAVVRGEDGRFGVIDKLGHWVIHPRFVSMDRFCEHVCAAAIRDESGREKWGYLTIDGDWAIQPKFSEAFEFNSGVAYVRPSGDEGDKFGYIDKSGNYVWEPS